MATPFIDSRFPAKDYNTMRMAVDKAQQQRATFQGPPVPSAPFGLDGVEKRATDALKMQQNQGPMRPMVVNGTPQFQAPAPVTPSMMAAPTPRPAPMMMGPAPAAAVNALSRGAPAGMGSMLGSPITPPNSLSRGASPGAASGLGGPVPVGRSANDPMRIAETARRRGNPALIMSLAGQQQDRQFQREMFGDQQQASAARDATNFAQGLQMFGAQQEAMDRRDATNFQQQQQMFQMQSQQRADESALEFQRRQEAEKADRELSMNVTTKAIPGTDYVIPFAGSKAMSTIPVTKPEAPLTADDVYAARQMGGNVQIDQGNTRVTLPGMDQPAPTNTELPKIYQGKPDNLGKPTRDYYYDRDPKTGKPVKVFIEDANGDGLPDAAPGGAQVAAAPAKKFRFMDLINAKR